MLYDTMLGNNERTCIQDINRQDAYATMDVNRKEKSNMVIVQLVMS